MSRWRFSSKTEADGLRKVEIWRLKKWDYLCGWKSGVIEWTSRCSETKNSISIYVSTMDNDNYIRFQYTLTKDEGKKDLDYKVKLVTTPCHYGGVRYWFICPLIAGGRYCGRRVGVLYQEGDYFGCRHCYDLTYESRNESKLGRLFDAGINTDELDELGRSIKKHTYRGKLTKRYLKYLKKSHRMEVAMLAIAESLN